MQSIELGLDVMAELKLSTAEQHKGVEQLMPFFRERFTQQQYARTLELFLGFFEPIEQRLRSVLEETLSETDLSRRQRSHFLRADLLALGISVDEIAKLPRCRDLPELSNRYHGLGCMYVLEGSTLGGQVIGRELVRRFGIGETSGASFFLSHGPLVGEMWKDFCVTVRSQVDSVDGRESALRAANDTFCSLGNWMRKVSIDE
jgi:heme oxygenase